MEALSVFDMLKIGIGPSSSHTLGPWRAVQRFVEVLRGEAGGLEAVDSITATLFGSLALTGIGHCTDKAICLALMGYDPETVPVAAIDTLLDEASSSGSVRLASRYPVTFSREKDVNFRQDKTLPGHANALQLRASVSGQTVERVYYSVGGGFVVAEGETEVQAEHAPLPYPTSVPEDLLRHCESGGFRIADMVLQNEQAWRTEAGTRTDLLRIWSVMRDCIVRGCHTRGTLPGGLHVKRRAADLSARLLGLDAVAEGRSSQKPKADIHPSAIQADAWIKAIQRGSHAFPDVLKWVSCFALAVNEENANLGRVVTAPTNGAAGVIPAVLMYHICFSLREVGEEEIVNFLLVAGEIGTFFKKEATISAAMGGCQAEIGVSSAMAAAALCEALGGTVGQSLMAAEIAMEHHLGMTCDPIAGLVQIPCIERNSMGAIKAINAAELALESDPGEAKVSLDEVICTMWETARDMNTKYKETSLGGLAANISVRVPEC